jgi:hypothetical protein
MRDSGCVLSIKLLSILFDHFKSLNDIPWALKILLVCWCLCRFLVCAKRLLVLLRAILVEYRNLRTEWALGGIQYRKRS